LKPGWIKFWLCTSLLLMAGNCFAVEPPRPTLQAASPRKAHGANETLLAGLRPGRDTFAMALKRFKSRGLSKDGEADLKQWRDSCSGRSIRLELDSKNVIQSMTVTTIAPRSGKCSNRLEDFLDSANWETGRGLRIGDPMDRVTDLYGEPNSNGPSTKAGHELVLLYYQFDWAGSDVPQVMEVLCDRNTGRVVEITLAYPSL
jgi:hypothetical protein